MESFWDAWCAEHRSFPNEMGQNGSTRPVCRRGENNVRSNSYIQIFNGLKDYEVKRS